MASSVDWTALLLLGQSAKHMSCLVLALSHSDRFIHHQLSSVDSTCKVTCMTCEKDNVLLVHSRKLAILPSWDFDHDLVVRCVLFTCGRRDFTVGVTLTLKLSCEVFHPARILV